MFIHQWLRWVPVDARTYTQTQGVVADVKVYRSYTWLTLRDGRRIYIPYLGSFFHGLSKRPFRSLRGKEISLNVTPWKNDPTSPRLVATELAVDGEVMYPMSHYRKESEANHTRTMPFISLALVLWVPFGLLPMCGRQLEIMGHGMAPTKGCSPISNRADAV
jgi:hypothetical protein